MSDGFPLRREHLLSENLARAAELFRSLGLSITTPEERAASLGAILARTRPGEDVWVFGYGSLMWNPAFHHVATSAARVRGWHRSFCLWNTFGRGSPENPGLTLALEPGGSCLGLALRVEATAVQSELTLLWNREMLSGSYVPRWVQATSPEGPIEAVTFVANAAHDRYAGRLPVPQIAERLARARGPLGAAREYLERTVEELERHGARRGSMHDLLTAVRALT